MPLLTCLFLSGQTHHVIQRGSNRQPVFHRSRPAALPWLAREALRPPACALHAYVLATNHVRLLLTAERPDALPRLMQSLS